MKYRLDEETSREKRKIIIAKAEFKKALAKKAKIAAVAGGVVAVIFTAGPTIAPVLGQGMVDAGTKIVQNFNADPAENTPYQYADYGYLEKPVAFSSLDELENYCEENDIDIANVRAWQNFDGSSTKVYADKTTLVPTEKEKSR